MTKLHLTFFLLAALCTFTAAKPGDLRYGRATFYGNEPWLWSIHEGSCGYNYIFPDEPLGWDVAALADVHYEYSGSCGKCYEVFCEPMNFNDGYGNQLGRDSVCYDPEASVVVRIVDTCPCNYPNNFYSNKRWCCGDMDHFDLSIWAFEKLADMKWGVIGLKYRPVSCDYVPAKEASAPGSPFPGVPPPPGVSKPWPPRFVERNSGSSTTPVVDRSQESAKNQENNESGEAQTHEQPVFDPPEVVAFSGPKDDRVGIYGGAFAEDWKDDSWGVSNGGKIKGPSGGRAICQEISPGGAISFKTQRGGFRDKVSLEFWVKTDQGTPDVNINIEGPKGFCRFVRLLDINTSGNLDGFSRYDLFLGNFDRYEDEVVAFASYFQGCGGNGPDEVNKIVFKNDLPGHSQEVCIDSIQLLGD